MNSNMMLTSSSNESVIDATSTGILDIEKQLLSLRVITEQFGVMHEAQILQIRLWPHSIDPKLESSVANIDVENAEIFYQWKSNTKKIDKKYLNRLEELHNSMCRFFGDGWRLRVDVNGTVVYPVNTVKKKTVVKKTVEKKKNVVKPGKKTARRK